MPLGIVLKNEAKGDEMVDIMRHIHQYVPTVEHVEEITLSTGEEVRVCREAMHQILVGGDQMTAARARSAKKAQANGEKPSCRLEGLIAAFEDWHSKANIMGVSNV